MGVGVGVCVWVCGCGWVCVCVCDFSLTKSMKSRNHIRLFMGREPKTKQHTSLREVTKFKVENLLKPLKRSSHKRHLYNQQKCYLIT